MKPVYTDLHIHTSENADELNKDYNVELLVDRVKEFAKSEDILLSLTDHNVINREAYISLQTLNIDFIVGVELHIRNYKGELPYHCHAYFDMDDKVEEKIVANIDEINDILNDMYPKKMVNGDDDIPFLEDIVKSFDKYDFVLLPHGGQSHSTFDTTIPDGVVFDTVMERNIYYNQFDGFTSRSNKGLERTQKYFSKLGIASFVNLITCTDNYIPQKYPDSKSVSSEKFIPTWILSEPTFSGLRLALSESGRLKYQQEQPPLNSDYIKSIKLKNDLVDIDVKLTQGLNVIIGGSSSGKTLFMDSLYRKISNSFDDYDHYAYSKFMVDQILVENPAGYKPHYISQNYITKVIDEKYEEGIEKIDIIKNTFKGNEELDQNVSNGLNSLNEALLALITAVENIENSISSLRSIPAFPRIVSNDTLNKNPYQYLLPSSELESKIKIKKLKIDEYFRILDEILELSQENPFMLELNKEIKTIKEELNVAYYKGGLFEAVKKEIKNYKDNFDKNESQGKEVELIKQKNRESLLFNIKAYITNLEEFNKQLGIIEKFSIEYKTDSIKSQGHKLFIKNEFKLNKEIILQTINELLKKEYRVSNFKEITPYLLFEDHFSKRNPIVHDYKDFRDKMYSKIAQTNKKIYKIITKDGRDLDELSPGWKTAILLDIVLGYDEDIAPIFIDQPEDNLATNYINKGLVESIKLSKDRRQILVISHNATIPMLADAQNIVYCKNVNGKIVIRSNPMEAKFGNRSVIDYIADITDGGKTSIKKRVKKYNLKKFREDEEHETTDQ